jgi:transposase
LPPGTLVVRSPRPGRARSCCEPSTPPTVCWRPAPPWSACYRWVDGVEVGELTRLARTVGAWQAEILAWHATDGCSNGPTEAVNLLIKQVKRVGHGFRNFANYRLRLLLHCGVAWQTHRTARLRGRAPRLVA